MIFKTPINITLNDSFPNKPNTAIYLYITSKRKVYNKMIVMKR